MSEKVRERPMRIGELAARTGVSPDTLRLYERKGLLPKPERSAGGYRLYGPEARRRVGVIRAGLAVGLSLAELAEVVRMRDRGLAPCRRVRALVEGKLREVEHRLGELEAAREHMCALLRQWDARLEGAAPGERAGLLEALAAGPPRAGRHPLHAPVAHRERGGEARGRRTERR